MKKWLLVTIILLTLVAIPANAYANSPDYFACGLTYEAYDNLTELHGRISTVCVDAEKRGKGGIEQDIEIKNAQGTATIEVANWWYGNRLRVGLIVSQDGQYPFIKRCLAQIGSIYSYKVEIIDGTIHSTIWDSEGGVLVSYSWECEAEYIERTSSYIEYWRYDKPGSFFYYGYVTIENTAQVQFRDDFYHKSKGLPFGFYLIHHNWESVLDKGEIDDR